MSLFDQRLMEFRKLCPRVKEAVSSRAEQVIPRIRLKNSGRYSYVEGISALAKRTRRSEAYLVKLFKIITGAIVEAESGDQVRIRGNLPERTLKMFYNRYLENVLCGDCKSPETTMANDSDAPEGNYERACKNCGKVTKDKYL